MLPCRHQLVLLEAKLPDIRAFRFHQGASGES